KRASFVGGSAGTRSQVIEAPNALPNPVRPLKALVLGTAMAAGCVLGLRAALGAEWVDPEVRSAAEVRQALRLPVLGELPFVAEAQAPRHSPVGLIYQAMPRSPTAESYRVVRANLDLARRHRDARVVMVTAPRGGEGKSAVASNLAVTLAQAGRRVLLVDADLRTPSQHATFGLTRDRGLVHLLRGLLTPERVVQPTSVADLDLVASGPEVANPAELLSAPGLAGALAWSRRVYDTVVIDATSLLTVADPSIVAAAADAVVLVVRVSETKWADASRAVEALKGIGTPVLGVVINGPNPDTAARPWPSHAGVDAGGTGRAPSASEIPYDPRMTFSPGAEHAGNGHVPDVFPTTEKRPHEAIWLSMKASSPSKTSRSTGRSAPAISGRTRTG
ncbi:MAG: CpsD/CapB family tyrosine-protein kinase, partial [Planctomycetia bacterium]|nr:CpsD/CapB family tyrosine-protein kinase [Planctomycetia bacterium]